MKTLLPEGLRGKELFRYLIANKSTLIKAKKSVMKYGEGPSRFYHVDKSGKLVGVNKASGSAADKPDDPGDEEEGIIHVKVVANASNYCDSQMDVLLPDCWKKSIKERGDYIPHLHDHIQQLSEKIGEVTSIYSQDIKLKDLGWDGPGSTQCLIFETDVMEAYNDKIYNQYKLKKIDQHSIGLRYMQLELAINDEDSEKEMDFWNKYYDQIINKDAVDEYGFFWVVPEIALIENSCVIAGANDLTPTLETDGQPGGKSTSQQQKEPTFDVIKAIRESQFI